MSRRELNRDACIEGRGTHEGTDVPRPDRSSAQAAGARLEDQYRSIAYFSRPSDRRSPGNIPGPQCAFDMSMFNVPCNSHYFTQLAAFFIDPRAE